ncbi:hypothetical protein CDOO_00735 [Corynebacterium doosanense CAU 212 = DSM 45436]|uniref:Uncharacterized protein n=1 Tax=Corynebacterium doosanense CAU 212 = DSM 45436 TaxID=558173 RepID=A0A097IJ18_9CORY|nr:hypothetical protein CDOO_00735 [Corynebacterium doosanense CAU 212 = DSM 45436]
MMASDTLADEIMAQFGAASPEAFVNLTALEGTGFGPILTLFLSGVALAGSAVQILALVTRVLVIPIVAGLTPLFAALSFTETGRQGLNHLVAYLLTGIAFKPVSALLYSVVLWNVSDNQSGQDVSAAVINALMIGLAGFTAPALVRAIVPLAAQAGGGAAAPMLSGSMGAVGALGGGALGAAAGAATSASGKLFLVQRRNGLWRWWKHRVDGAVAKFGRQEDLREIITAMGIFSGRHSPVKSSCGRSGGTAATGSATAIWKK